MFNELHLGSGVEELHASIWHLHNADSHCRQLRQVRGISCHELRRAQTLVRASGHVQTTATEYKT